MHVDCHTVWACFDEFVYLHRCMFLDAAIMLLDRDAADLTASWAKILQQQARPAGWTMDELRLEATSMLNDLKNSCLLTLENLPDRHFLSERCVLNPCNCCL